MWGRAQVPGRQSPNCLLAEHEAREIPWQSSIEDSMAFTAEGVGSIPGQETAIPQAMQHSQKNLKKQKHEAQKTSTEEGSPRQRLCLPGSCRDAPVDPGWATPYVEARRWEGPPSPEQHPSHRCSTALLTQLNSHLGSWVPRGRLSVSSTDRLSWGSGFYIRSPPE